MTLENLPSWRSLANQSRLAELGFPEALGGYSIVGEREQEQSSTRNTRPTRIYHTHCEDPRPRMRAEDHRPIKCTMSDRRQIPLSK